MAKFLCGVAFGAAVVGLALAGMDFWKHSRRISVSDILTVYLVEPRAVAAASGSNPSDGFPMSVVVTRIEPNGIVAFEGTKKVSTSGNDCWTHSLRGKIDPSDI